MPWTETTKMELRHEFVTLATKEDANMSVLCRRFGISRDTGYKWLRRYREEGKSGLADRSRRPHSSPGKTPDYVEAVVYRSSRLRGAPAAPGLGRTQDPRPSSAQSSRRAAQLRRREGARRLDHHSHSASQRSASRERLREGAGVPALRKRAAQRALADGLQRRLRAREWGALLSADGRRRPLSLCRGASGLPGPAARDRPGLPDRGVSPLRPARARHH